jgi:hypothetical protein
MNARGGGDGDVLRSAAGCIGGPRGAADLCGVGILALAAMPAGRPKRGQRAVGRSRRSSASHTVRHSLSALAVPALRLSPRSGGHVERSPAREEAETARAPSLCARRFWSFLLVATCKGPRHQPAGGSTPVSEYLHHLLLRITFGHSSCQKKCVKIQKQL